MSAFQARLRAAIVRGSSAGARAVLAGLSNPAHLLQHWGMRAPESPSVAAVARLYRDLDAVQADFSVNARGYLDKDAVIAWAGASTVSVARMYGASGVDALQATVAEMPPIDLSASPLRLAASEGKTLVATIPVEIPGAIVIRAIGRYVVKSVETIAAGAFNVHAGGALAEVAVLDAATPVADVQRVARDMAKAWGMKYEGPALPILRVLDGPDQLLNYWGFRSPDKFDASSPARLYRTSDASERVALKGADGYLDGIDASAWLGASAGKVARLNDLALTADKGLNAIQQMFLADDVGVLYDFATAAQVKEDSLAQVAAPVNGSVGAMLDLSRGLSLSDDLLPPGSAPSNSYTTVLSLGDGVYRCSFHSGALYNFARYGDLVSGVPGTFYTAEVEVRMVSPATASFRFDINGIPGLTATVTEEWQKFTVPARRHLTQPYRFVDINRGNVDCVYEVRNVTLRRVNGTPALQDTAGNKPTLRQTPTTGRYWLDAADPTRALNATFPTAPGDMHVGRVTPEGMIWATETWAATQNVLKTVQYNAGIVARKRAFSAPEMALIDAYFRRQLPKLGDNLAVNPGFDSPDGWFAYEGWSIEGGKAIRSSGAAHSNLSRSAITIGKQVFFGFTLDQRTSGSVRGITLTHNPDVNVPGRYRWAGVSAWTTVGARSYTEASLVIDDASIQEIL